MRHVGIIGCGHWGRNYTRVFYELSSVERIVCCDRDKQILGKLVEQYSSLQITDNYKNILENPEIKAVVIATPAASHFKLASDCLIARKHLLVEKPLTLKVDEAKELEELAKKNNLTLMVGHTFLFNAGIQKVNEYINEEKCGALYYLHARRTHMGLIREDVNAAWDLAPHDVYIFSHLLGENPVSVSAIGGSYLNENKEDVAFITLKYPSGAIGNIHVSWADSNKIRKIEVVGSRARLIFDDLENLEKVKIFEKGISTDRSYDSFAEFQYVLRDGDIISPKIFMKEPLKEQCIHFLDCINSKKKPLSNARDGVEVVKIMCAIEQSIKQDGAPILI